MLSLILLLWSPRRDIHWFTSPCSISPVTKNFTCTCSPWVLPATNEEKSHILVTYYANVGLCHLIRHSSSRAQSRNLLEATQLCECSSWDLNPAAAVLPVLLTRCLTLPSKFSLLPKQTRGLLHTVPCYFLKHVETVGEIYDL